MWFIKNKKDKNKKFKLALFVIAIITLVSWIIWFGFVLNFVNQGVTITMEEFLVFKVEVDKFWQTNAKIMGIINVILTGVCFILEVIYVVKIGKHLKTNIKVNSYELAIHMACAIGILIGAIKSADMLIKDTWSIYIPTITSLEDIEDVKLYFDKFITCMSVSAAFIVFSTCSLSMSGKKAINVRSIMQDTNIMLIAFGFIVLALYPFFMVGITPGKNAVVGEIEVDRIFNHFSGALTGNAMSVFAGTMMVIMVLRLIANMFLAKSKIDNKHIAGYTVILVLVTVSFIFCHATGPVDMQKFLSNQSFIPLTIMWTLQTSSCLAGAIYGCISFAKHK